MAKIIRKQSSIENLVFDLETLQQVDNNAQLERGDLSLLSTFDKSDLVHAINEVNAETDNNKNSIDDINELIGSEKLGTELFYYTLQTVNKTLINAINEVNANVNTLDNSVLKKTDNLLSLSNKSLARTNLDVYNKTETENLIHQAEINLGTNFSVATIAQRNTLTNLTIGDNVFVKDAGDGKWVIDRVTALIGSVPTFERIMDQDVYLNAISKEAIKASYESNPDTNAYTNIDKTKVGYLSVTSAINLDKVIQNDELNISTSLTNASNTDIASSLAIKTYIDTNTLKKSNNLSDLSNKSLARTNLDVYNKTETEQLLLNAAFGGITVEDLTNMAADIEKAKKNYFFGLDLLGSLR